MGHTINDSDNRYNGWTNYATWRVALEMFDNIDARDWFAREIKDDDAYALSHQLEEYVSNAIDDSGASGFVADYARAFLADVNWYEIAEHMLDAIKADEA